MQTLLLEDKIREKDIQKPTSALSVQAIRNLVGEYAGGLLYGGVQGERFDKEDRPRRAGLFLSASGLPGRCILA